MYKGDLTYSLAFLDWRFWLIEKKLVALVSNATICRFLWSFPTHVSDNSPFHRANTSQLWFVQFAIKSLSHLILLCTSPCHSSPLRLDPWQWLFLLVMDLLCRLLVLWMSLSRGAAEIWSMHLAIWQKREGNLQFLFEYLINMSKTKFSYYYMLLFLS